MRHARGFTLLEMLVAIAMVAIITASLYSALYVGFRAQRSATRAVEPARAATLTLQLLEQDLEGAMSPTGILAGQFLGTDSQGLDGADGLAFYSSANVPIAGESGADTRHVEFIVAAALDDAQPALYRRVTSNLLPSNAPLIREQVLCRNVKAFSLRYFDGTQWLESWDSTGQGDLLPLGVEVQIEFILPVTDPRDTEARFYRMRRVFEIPCGRTAASATAEAAP
jgi:prepilin-type N-terminal cleavage/methylation domain-containing protein